MTANDATDRALDALEGMVERHCFLTPDGYFETEGSVTNRDAMDTFAALRPERWTVSTRGLRRRSHD
jgi:hypothetical protein